MILDSPGVYYLRNSETNLDLPIAVNLDPAESRVMPLDADVLEAAGIPLGISDEIGLVAVATAEEAASRRELEASQKHWRWLLLAAVVLLLIETWYAGRLSSRQAVSAV
jgi:anti-sigma-K factor RskA